MQTVINTKANTFVAPDKAEKTPSDSMVEFRSYANPENFGSRFRWRGIGLAVVDCLAVGGCIFLTFFVVTTIRYTFDIAYPIKYAEVLAVPMGALPVVLWCSCSWGHYIRIKPFWTETRELLKMIFYTAAVVATVLVALSIDLSRLWIFTTLALMCVICPLGRYLAKIELAKLQAWFAPLVIVGDHERVKACSEAIASDRTLGYQVVASVEIKNLDLSLIHI